MADTYTHILTPDDIDRLVETTYTHQHNAQAVRHYGSLGDAAGFTKTGVHIVRIAPGSQASEPHSHEIEEEWVYILSGRALSVSGTGQRELGPGTFIAYRPGGPAHTLKNPFDQDLVFLCGGERSPFDICTYPGAGRRQFRHGDRREWVETKDIRIVDSAAQRAPANNNDV